MATSELEFLDFENTQKAFAYKSDNDLKQTRRLFGLMNNSFLVNVGSSVTNFTLKLRLPFVKSLIKATIFRQFVGGESLQEAQKNIELLYKYGAQTILDYGAESKSSEEELDKVVTENKAAISFARNNISVPIVVSKITGLADNDLLIKMQSKSKLNGEQELEKKKLFSRLDSICKTAYDNNVSVMIDAEESWFQDTIDSLAEQMMEQYNKDKVIVFNTYQMYRHDKLTDLHSAYEKSQSRNYLLGAKLVRGAYMDKERDYAIERAIPSVIQASKEDTDIDYNKAINFCVENYKSIASVCASHNAKSNYLQAHLIDKLRIDKRHPHLNFCQLFGMSDNLTFNLAQSGYNVAKYLPYGPVSDVIPYLIRRAKENTAVTNDVSRELRLVRKEIKRRGLSS